MKKMILFVLVLLFALPAFAEIWYLEIPASESAAMIERLDVLKGPSPYTLHYTEAITSWMATVTTVLIPVDERAQSVLTEAEWNSKKTEMPDAFKRPLPLGN